MIRSVFVALIFCFVTTQVHTQKKVMTPDVYDIWHSINNVKISDSGKWVTYLLEPGKGDSQLVVYNTDAQEEIRVERADKAFIDKEESFIVFRRFTALDSIEILKRKKTKKEKMPRDTLGILNLSNDQIQWIPDVEKFTVPEDYGNIVVYQLYGNKQKQDSTLVKDQGSENGYRIGLFHAQLDTTIYFDYIKHYTFAEDSARLLLHGTGTDTINKQWLGILDTHNMNLDTLGKIEGKLSRFAINHQGNKVAFIANQDTTKSQVPPYQIIHWQQGWDSLTVLVDSNASFLDSNWYISPHYTPRYSEDDNSLYFGIAPKPMSEDTTILEDEKVEVEIWHYQDPLLYTQQEAQAKREKERSYEVRYDIKDGSFIALATEEVPVVRIDKKIEGDYTVGYHEEKYQQNISWLGYAFKDVYLINLKTGEKEMVAEKIQGSPRISPAEKYIYWYSRPDTAWYSYEIESKTKRQLTSGGFYDEINDRPMHPSGSGSAAWTKDDKHFLIYDHYDIWRIDPGAERGPVNLTQGRSLRWRYRYISLDKDLEYLSPDTSILVKVFDEKDKSSGYGYLNIADGNFRMLEKGPYEYTTRIIKAKASQKIIFTRSSFTQFPDLILSNTQLKDQMRISHANPQQSEYNWGTIELVKWTDPLGREIHGMLVKPENFDPSKKYPMIVNFYERSSHRLHRHPAPYPHRSTINYSYYASRGYVIFNPDIIYTRGYPGKSCEMAVNSGVDMILQKGFVDPHRMGLQGHSWGGYQIAHLLTLTDRFRCAEAGAPVVNMVSAYGGIRWGSGMSRMFQYERTQSRLGYTLWERPDLYLENSPIFNIDKVETPVLILHNDKDGAVPWYQGIEYFVALRRLGKPAWLLNYNDEPHWPVKRHNRLDFNLRLQQFFDHFLKGEPMPQWMQKGVPAVEKGLNYGF